MFLLVAVGLVGALLVAGLSALVVVLRSHPATDTDAQGANGSRPGSRPGAVVAPTTTTTVTTTTTTPPASAATAGVMNPLPSTLTDPSTVATATVRSLPLYSQPGAPSAEGTLANPTTLGAKLVLLVVQDDGPWIEVYTPVRPNGSKAWIPAADVTLSSDPYHIQVSLSQHELTLYENNVPTFSTPVATGAPDSPTPTGSFFVAFIVKLTDPDNVYGPYALGTSAFSNTYYSFEGGPGQIGIHGTNQPWVIGTYASHGCVRLPNAAITTVATQIPPGTPVEIGP